MWPLGIQRPIYTTNGTSNMKAEMTVWSYNKNRSTVRIASAYSSVSGKQDTIKTNKQISVEAERSSFVIVWHPYHVLRLYTRRTHRHVRHVVQQQPNSEEVHHLSWRLSCVKEDTPRPLLWRKEIPQNLLPYPYSSNDSYDKPLSGLVWNCEGTLWGKVWEIEASRLRRAGVILEGQD